jgi:hypothetical protein
MQFNHPGQNVAVSGPDNVSPVTGTTDGPFIVHLLNQAGESLPFIEFDQHAHAVQFADDVRIVMEERSRALLRDEPVGEPDMNLWDLPDGTQEIYLYISADDDSVTSGPLSHLEHAVPMMNWLVDWCEEWQRIYCGPTEQEMSSVVGELVDILAEVGGHLTCAEADRVAAIARLYVGDAEADLFLGAHAAGDSADEEDAPHHLALIQS